MSKILRLLRKDTKMEKKPLRPKIAQRIEQDKLKKAYTTICPECSKQLELKGTGDINSRGLMQKYGVKIAENWECKICFTHIDQTKEDGILRSSAGISETIVCVAKEIGDSAKEIFNTNDIAKAYKAREEIYECMGIIRDVIDHYNKSIEQHIRELVEEQLDIEKGRDV
jgi:hypothetical protein